jgi:hypothetical protein
MRKSAKRSLSVKGLILGTIPTCLALLITPAVGGVDKIKRI